MVQWAHSQNCVGSDVRKIYQLRVTQKPESSAEEM